MLEEWGAVAIQSAFRGRAARREVEAQERSAVEVQRMWRGRHSRQVPLITPTISHQPTIILIATSDAHTLRFCRQVNDPLYGLPPWAEGAASRIQSRWRGSKARQELGPAVAEHTAGRSAAAATVQRGLRRRAARRAAGEEVKQRRLQVSLPPTARKPRAHFASPIS